MRTYRHRKLAFAKQTERADHNRKLSRQRTWRSLGLKNPDGSAFVLADYDEILSLQKERCAVCNELRYQKYALHIDHNHKTGIVRGVLCSRCNTATGIIENFDLASKIKTYLDKHTH
jgi:hypothetical protein